MKREECEAQREIKQADLERFMKMTSQQRKEQAMKIVSHSG